MDMEKVKDLTATGAGGGSGIDMLYTGIDGMLRDGIDAPEVKLVIYGLIALVTGFFAFRRQRPADNPVMIQP